MSKPRLTKLACMAISIILITACSSGSSDPSAPEAQEPDNASRSSVANGYYLISESIVAEATRNEDLSYTETFAYSLTNGENSLSYTKFRNGEQESAHLQTFNADGSPLVLSLVRADGSSNTWETNSYNDNGQLELVDTGSNEYRFIYDGELLIKREYHTDRGLSAETTFEYDTSSKLISSLSQFVPTSGPNEDTERCTYRYEAALRVGYECESYNSNNDTWSISTTATFTRSECAEYGAIPE